MDCARSREITDLLKAWGAGDHTALDRLAPAIDQELRRLAKAYLKREPADQTLQTTALINEAYLRLIEIRECAVAGPGSLFCHLSADDAPDPGGCSPLPPS